MPTLPEEVKQLIKNNPLLDNRIGLLVLGGSHAYGTSIEGKSDIDVRGFAFEPTNQLIGTTKNYEAIVDTVTDTTIYSFNKFVHLLTENNPNILEMMGCNAEHYFYTSSVALDLINNLDKFLSQRVEHTFGSYAKAQLRRMENSIHGDNLDSLKELDHLKTSIERAMINFESTYNKYTDGDVSIYIDEEDNDLKLDINFKAMPVTQLTGILSEFENVRRQYKKINHRNKKKGAEHLDKHAMHIIRLLLTGIELLETGKMQTHREKNKFLLMAIRNGHFRNPDGTYNTAYYDLKVELDKKFEYAKAHTVLSAKPNYEWIEEFVIKTNYNIIQGRW